MCDVCGSSIGDDPGHIGQSILKESSEYLSMIQKKEDGQMEHGWMHGTFQQKVRKKKKKVSTGN